MRNQVAFIDGDSLVVVDLTGLGVVMVVFGALLALAGIGLFVRNSIARVAAIVIVSLHALAQVGSLGAYPVWSLLMITLDVLILFALTVHWAPRELESMLAPPATGGVHRADRDQAASAREAFPMNQPRAGAHAATSDMPEKSAQDAEYADYSGQQAYQAPGSSYPPGAPDEAGKAGPAAGPYPPGRGTSSPAHSSAPTSGHGAGAI
jgi:hypothetical protein